MAYSGKTIADYPQLLSEWDESKNGVSASSVAFSSNRRFWWRCSDGHEFEAKANSRVRGIATRGKPTACPVCYAATVGQWTWETIVAKALEKKREIGYLPPATWFQNNGLAALVGAIYTRHKKTWTDLREATESFESSSLAQSRSGSRWRSKAEACLSDFLYARRIEQRERAPLSAKVCRSVGQALRRL